MREMRDIDDFTNRGEVGVVQHDFLGNSVNPVLNVPMSDLNRYNCHTPSQYQAIQKIMTNMWIARVEAAIWLSGFIYVVAKGNMQELILVRSDPDYFPAGHLISLDDADRETWTMTLTNGLNEFSNTASLLYSVVVLYLFNFAYFQFAVIKHYCENVTAIYVKRGKVVHFLQFYNGLIYLSNILAIVAYTAFVIYDVDQYVFYHYLSFMIAVGMIFFSHIIELIFFCVLNEQRLNPTVSYFRMFGMLIHLVSAILCLVFNPYFSDSVGNGEMTIHQISEWTNFINVFLLLSGTVFNWDEIWAAVPPNYIIQQIPIFSIIGMFQAVFSAWSPWNQRGGYQATTNAAGQTIINSEINTYVVDKSAQTQKWNGMDKANITNPAQVV